MALAPIEKLLLQTKISENRVLGPFFTKPRQNFTKKMLFWGSFPPIMCFMANRFTFWKSLIQIYSNFDLGLYISVKQICCTKGNKSTEIM